ncbi:MAG: dihydrofolate reductase [Verrucomicrobia bacterium]|nr:dihydrofolate reductase [Verrucomicrobiota bacterium]
MFKRILGIGACDEKGVLGKNGTLPWYYPEDLKHFQSIIGDTPLVMGRKTFLSMPRHYFTKRVSIIFTHSPHQFDPSPNLIFVTSLAEFLSLEQQFNELYVIGGAQIYNLFLKENLIQEFILTKIKKSYEGDVFFPLSLLSDWPRLKEDETDSFSIYRYLKPSKIAYADKNA